MALVHEWQQQGNFLFRYRSWIPFLFVLAALVYLFVKPNMESYFYSPRWIAICFSISFIGAVIRALTIGYVAPNTSGRNTKQGQVADVVNTTGMYSQIRHPLYLGNYFMWLGCFVYLGSISFVIIASLGYFLYYERIMFAEEQFLRQKFPEEYDNWAKDRNAFFPKFSKWIRPQVGFQWKKVIRQEYLGIFAILFMICTFAIFNASRVSNQLFVPNSVKEILLANSILFLFFRLLIKYTPLVKS